MNTSTSKVPSDLSDFRENNSFSSILSSGLLSAEDLEVLAAMTEYADVLKAFNIHVRVSTKASEQILMVLPVETKLNLAQNLRLNAGWIRAELDEMGTLEPNVDTNVEIRVAKRVLSHYGLRVSDRFWSTLSDGDMLEIYSFDMIQIYRSFNFFKVCGYTLLEVSTMEWYKLWERPKAILAEMWKCADQMVQTQVELGRYEVPRHVVREVMPSNLAENYKPCATLVEFKNFSTAIKEIEGVGGAGIVSLRSELIATGPEAFSIQFV